MQLRRLLNANIRATSTAETQTHANSSSPVQPLPSFAANPSSPIELTPANSVDEPDHWNKRDGENIIFESTLALCRVHANKTQEAISLEDCELRLLEARGKRWHQSTRRFALRRSGNGAECKSYCKRKASSSKNDTTTKVYARVELTEIQSFRAATRSGISRHYGGLPSACHLVKL